ncbi:radical SAM protein [Sorangium cellulosum]|uniref:Radical SAM protein n=1 Tax=Sorangium cellulosum TaxID=56 RepID=A0A150TNH1_SORCE|nr:radical SAM protein [Sorangium cellulosum]
MLVTDGSRIYALDEGPAAQIRAAMGAGREAVRALLDGLGLAGRRYVDDAPIEPPPLRALSLAVAMKCNLACTYCYAQEGQFGGPARDMPWEVAEAAVRRLLDGAAPGERALLAFLGGEPLVNRDVLRRATELAAALAAERRVHLRLSITTNGTLLTPDDAEFFERHGFAVTVSIDGVGEAHDQLRPFKGGRGSHARVLERVTPLLAAQRRMQVMARVTVTPRNLRLREALDALLELGFSSVGFSPMLSSPKRRDELTTPGLEQMLAEMIACGRELERRALAGEPYPFSNMTSAMQEIHRGAHRPYPCGAGGGYLGVSAEGGLFSCHRFVNDEAGEMGDVHTGVDLARQRRWLEERHVHRQEPCRTCWARQLCGGGCHHEVIHAGRPACDYVRGWLSYCLEAYVRLLGSAPWLFTDGCLAPPTSELAGG